MKRMISAGSRAYTYPDVTTELGELSYMLDEFRIQSDYMQKSTEETYQLERLFKSPEQAQAYIEAVQQLESELGELYQRFVQISGITED